MAKIKGLRLWLVASCLPLPYNLNEDKHVESSSVPRLDEGSIPSSSTFNGVISPRNNKKGIDNLIDYQCLSSFLHPLSWQHPLKPISDSGSVQKDVGSLTNIHTAPPAVCCLKRMGKVIGKCSKSETNFFSSETNFFCVKYCLTLNLYPYDYHIRLQKCKSQ